MNIISWFERFNINKPFLGILILFTAICALNIPILITLWRHSFDDGTYSHAFLIPFISLFLYYELAQSGKLQFREAFSAISATLLLLSSYLLFITSNAQISIGYWVSLLAVFMSSVTMLYRFNWYVVFPAAFLIFIFPFWGVLVPILQNISVIAVTYMMSFSGVPTYVEAEIITIPAGVFEIAGGCSGLRYIIVSLAIGSLFIFLNIKDTKKAALFLSLTILGALLTNWIRITALILIGEYTNMESSLMEDHNTFGWYLYVPFMILLFIVGNSMAGTNTTNTKAIMNIPSNTIRPNPLVFFALLFMIASSSTGLKRLSNLGELERSEFINTSSNYQSEIHYVSSIENIPFTNKTINIDYKKYNFNGDDLDGKPTFYDHKLIPSDWKIMNEKVTFPWRVNYLTHGSEKVILLYSYEIEGFMTSSLKDFKLARLTNALKNIKETKLHIIFSYCGKDCAENEKLIINATNLKSNINLAISH